MDRLRVATVWFGGCSGCHMSFLDLDEFLIDLADLVDIVYSPVVDMQGVSRERGCLPHRRRHLQRGQPRAAHKIRARTKVLVSFGDCAVTGNVPAMRNQLGLGNAESVLQRAYIEGAQSNPCVPSEPGIVPPLLDRVMPVHEVVPVEYFLPGCPPPADRIKAFMSQVLAGQDPETRRPPDQIWLNPRPL